MEKEGDEIKYESSAEHFLLLRPHINNVLVSSHFKKEMPNFDIGLILDCKHEYFTRLHKFEEKIDGNYIFRALHNKKHIVYAINKNNELVFLRAFNNFKEYGKFLADKKKIFHLLEKF